MGTSNADQIRPVKTSKAEQSASRALRIVLVQEPAGAVIKNFEQYRDILAGLEYFLPAVLREIHPEWKNESLDGFLLFAVRKTGELEAELIGDCIMISDQTTTPFHLRIQVALLIDEISWLELKLGERGENGMVRGPYVNPPAVRRLQALKDGVDTIDWVYKVTFGQRRER